MYNLEERAYFTTLGELRLLLADFPDDTKVCSSGVWGSYLHIEEDKSLISFDDEDLDEYYSTDCPEKYEDYDFAAKHYYDLFEHCKRRMFAIAPEELESLKWK